MYMKMKSEYTTYMYMYCNKGQYLYILYNQVHKESRPHEVMLALMLNVHVYTYTWNAYCITNTTHSANIHVSFSGKTPVHAHVNVPDCGLACIIAEKQPNHNTVPQPPQHYIISKLIIQNHNTTWGQDHTNTIMPTCNYYIEFQKLTQSR